MPLDNVRYRLEPLEDWRKAFKAMHAVTPEEVRTEKVMDEIHGLVLGPAGYAAMIQPHRLSPGSYHPYGLVPTWYAFLVGGERLYDLQFACDA